MTAFEFAQVSTFWPLLGPEPESLDWRFITKEAGTDMFKQLSYVFASTDIDGATHRGCPKKYLHCANAVDNQGQVITVKYKHCGGGHWILVRQCKEIAVFVNVSQLPGVSDDECMKVEVKSAQGEVLWKRAAPKDKTLKISSMANSVKSAMAVTNKGTLQSRVHWHFDGAMVSVATHIIKEK